MEDWAKMYRQNISSLDTPHDLEFDAISKDWTKYGHSGWGYEGYCQREKEEKKKKK